MQLLEDSVRSGNTADAPRLRAIRICPAQRPENQAKLAASVLREALADGFAGILVRNESLSSQDKCEEFALAVAGPLGKMLPQERDGSVLRHVRDRGLDIGSDPTARYSDTRFGGDFHTDGAECDEPLPDVFGLTCVRQSPRGGEFHIVKAAAVYERLRVAGFSANELTSSMCFDRRRGPASVGEPPFARKPLFRVVHGHVSATYLRTYIQSGHANPGAPELTQRQLDMLSIMSNVLADKALHLTLKLTPGDTLLLCNRCNLHGRSTYPAAGNKRGRLLVRTWISCSDSDDTSSASSSKRGCGCAQSVVTLIGGRAGSDRRE